MQRPPPKLVATGAVDLLGNVGKIGGAAQKALVAARFGVILVLPEDNRKEIETLNDGVKFNGIVFIRHVRDLMKIFTDVTMEKAGERKIKYCVASWRTRTKR